MPEVSSGSASQPPRGSHQQVFQVKGIIIELKPRQKEVTIKHEAVPSYMPAMTMPFEVKNTNDLAGLQAGDPVSFRLTVTDTEGWVDQIRKIGPPSNAVPTTGQFRFVREVQPLNPGDLLPDYHFTNQLGQSFSLGKFKGQALAITFLFTRCPYPTFCPLMANHFAEAQQKLLARPQGPTNWHLVTISFDPQFDSPAVLKAYAEAYKYDPAHWSFATGTLVDITAIADQFGLAFWHDENGGLSHNLRTAVMDASGRIQKVFEGNQWTSDELVAELAKTASERQKLKF
jgi:protein SCO1/2